MMNRLKTDPTSPSVTAVGLSSGRVSPKGRSRGDWWFGLRGMAATERESKIRKERTSIMSVLL
jgi:hypothetical protein